MTICSVSWANHETKQHESVDVYRVSEAKKIMRKHIKDGDTDVHGSMTRVYSNGDWEPVGEIKLGGSNAVQMSNMSTHGYSY